MARVWLRFPSLVVRAVLLVLVFSTATWPDHSVYAEPVQIAVFEGRRRRRRRGRRQPWSFRKFVEEKRRQRARAMAVALTIMSAYRALVRLFLVLVLGLASGLLPALILLLVGLVLLSELILLAGVALGHRWLLGLALTLNDFTRRAIGSGFILAVAGCADALVADQASVQMAAACCGRGCGSAEGRSTIQVKENKASVVINGPAVLQLPIDSTQDERLAMVLCRLVVGPDSRHLFTHQQIADAFGKNSQQQSQNHMQKLAHAGGSLAKMILNPRGRPRNVAPQVLELVARHWERAPFSSYEETCCWLAEQKLPPGIALPTPEQLRRQTFIEGNLVVFRNSLKRVVQQRDAGVVIRDDVLIERLMEMVDRQDRLLQAAGATPIPTPGMVRAALGCPLPSSKFFSRTGLELLNALRKLTSAVSAQQDERLCETVGGTNLEALHHATLYCVLRLSMGQVAALTARSKSVVCRSLAAFAQVAAELDLFPPASNFSGVLGIDEKWIRVPKSFPKHERGKSGKFRYAYFAVDVVSGDLLHVDVFATCDAATARTFLMSLRAKGIRPKMVVTDMLASYENAIKDTFGNGVGHHYCLFHHLQAVRRYVRDKVGKEWSQDPLLRRLVDTTDNIYDCRDRRTAKKRLLVLMEMKEEVHRSYPVLSPLFDIINSRFPLVVNAMGRKDVPTTNNATERVIKAFNQHYKLMAGLESIETARIQLQLFRFFYRLTPMREPRLKEHRGLCPLERAGHEVRGIPVADYIRRFSMDWEHDGPELLTSEVSRTDEVTLRAA